MAEEPSFTIFFIFPLDALYNSPFDVTMATSDATYFGPKVRLQNEGFPCSGLGSEYIIYSLAKHLSFSSQGKEALSGAGMDLQSTYRLHLSPPLLVLFRVGEGPHAGLVFVTYK